jgi:hypothetical protein
MLTEDAARSIGMSAYYPYMRKVLNGILRALDGQFGRPLIMTNLQNTNKVNSSLWKQLSIEIKISVINRNLMK